jgi:hypothetical protein
MTQIEIGPQESFEIGPEESPVNRKLLVLVAIVLALLLLAMCYTAYLLIRSLQPAEAQVVQPVVLPPTQVIQVETTEILMPVVVNEPITTPEPAPAPVAVTVSTSPLWRFLSIDGNDIGTFENVGDPSQRLLARCIDRKRPSPDAGELYLLDESGLLKPQDGGQGIQRFEVVDRD